MDKLREKYIIHRFLRGSTLQEVGNLFGITRERVRQILSRNGITRAQGGAALQGRWTLEAKAEVLNQRSLRVRGCTWDEYVVLRRMRKPTSAFSQQRRNAKERGIGWKLKLWDWWVIWKSSGHWDERGRNSGEYVMCRYGDRGNYEVGNVHIATSNANGRESVQTRGFGFKHNPSRYSSSEL